MLQLIKQEVEMEKMMQPSSMRTKMVYLLVKWEEVLTILTVLCAVSAIGFGIAWLFLKDKTLLYLLIISSSFYFIGKNFWKFRHEFI